MQNQNQAKNSNLNLKQFNELMKEVARLPEESRSIVSVYSQGVLAMANMQKQEARNGTENKYQQMSTF